MERAETWVNMIDLTSPLELSQELFGGRNKTYNVV